MNQITQHEDNAVATAGAAGGSLRNLRFDASFVRELPGDPVLANVPRQVQDAAYTRVDPRRG